LIPPIGFVPGFSFISGGTIVARLFPPQSLSGGVNTPRARRRTMGLTETGAALAGCVLVLVVAIILDRRPYRPGKLNYIPLMIIALAAILVLGRHLLAFFL
jgi:hypothetical protein